MVALAAIGIPPRYVVDLSALTKNKKEQDEEALLGGGLPCFRVLSNLETSKTSTRVGKEEIKEKSFIRLPGRHVSIIPADFRLST